MQNPPGPPQGNPPVASSGVDKRTGALLSYLVGWVTGLIFLFVAKDDPDVKYHAAQSTVVFGSLSVVLVILWILRNVGGLGVIFGVLYFIVWLIGFILWLVSMYQAWTRDGARFEVPILGGVARPYVEQLMNSVA